MMNQKYLIGGGVLLFVAFLVAATYLLRKNFVKERALCGIGHVERCVEIAERATDIETINNYYRKGCDLNHRRSCFKLAQNLTRGVKGVTDLPGANKLYLKICDDHRTGGVTEEEKELRWRSCSTLGKHYLKGIGMKQDHALGLHYIQQGCSLGDVDSCHFMEQQHAIKELKLKIKQCDSGDGDSCEQVAHHYYYGLNCEQSYSKALDLMARACELKSGKGCFKLALYYEKSAGKNIDPQKASELYRKGCDLDHGESCFNLGYNTLHGDGVEKDLEGGNKLYRKGCRLDFAKACTNLGYSYEHGVGFERSEPLAIAFYGKGCDLGDQTGCDYLDQFE